MCSPMLCPQSFSACEESSRSVAPPEGTEVPCSITWMRRGWERASLGQWNELLIVARHGIEAGELPIGLGLLDALLARGDEVPPDVARPVHRCAAEQHEARIADRGDRDAIAGAEQQQPAWREPVAGDVDLARDEID